MHLSESVSESVLCADRLVESDYTAQTDRNTSYTYAHTRADPHKERSANGYSKGGGGILYVCVCRRSGEASEGVLINCTDVDFFKSNPRFTQ